MKALACVGIAALLLSSQVSAQVRVKGYVKRDGTYVAPYYRSKPNSTTLDNYSTKGNYNPYSGKVGTQNPYPNSYGNGSRRSSSSSYGSGSMSNYGYGSNSDEDGDE